MATETTTLPPPEQVKEEVLDVIKAVEDKPSELPATEEVKKADVITEPEEIILEAKEPEAEQVPKVDDSVTEEPKVTGEDVVEEVPTPAATLAEPEDKNIDPPLIEEPKITEQESNPVVEDAPSPVAPLAEPEEKIEAENIETPVIEEAKQVVEDVPSPVAPSAEPEEKIEADNIEPPVIEETKPVAEDVPSPAAPLGETEEKNLEPILIEAKEIPSAEPPLAESEEKIEEKNIEPPVIEELKIPNEEVTPVAEDVPSPEATLTALDEKIEEKIIETPVIEEPKIADEEAKPVVEDIPSPAAPLAESEEKIEEKIIETPVIEEPKTADEEAKPVVEDVPSPAAPLAESEEKIGDKNIEIPVIEEPKVTPSEPESITEEKTEVETDKTHVDSVEVKEVQVALPVQEPEPTVVAEEIPKPVPAVEESLEKEAAVVEPKESVNLGTLLKEDASIKDEPTNIETVVDVPKGNENGQESTQTEPVSVPEKSTDVENISRDVDLAAVTNGGEGVNEKVESVEEPKKAEAEDKGEENLLTEETKVSEDLPKEEVAVKSTQKQSNSLISKVKSSLVKAKKAIIGKSPNPKATTPTDTKEEVTV